VQEGKPAGADAGLGIGLRADSARHAARQLLHGAIDAGAKDAVLGSEQLVDDRLGHPRPSRQLLH
jgi:hypothetical protein